MDSKTASRIEHEGKLECKAMGDSDVRDRLKNAIRYVAVGLVPGFWPMEEGDLPSLLREIADEIQGKR